MNAHPNESGKEGRVTSYRIFGFANELVEKSERVAQRVEEKLNPIMSPAKEEIKKEEIEEIKVGEIYPPYFSELQNKFIKIEASLNRIDAFLARTEL